MLRASLAHQTLEPQERPDVRSDPRSVRASGRRRRGQGVPGQGPGHGRPRQGCPVRVVGGHRDRPRRVHRPGRGQPDRRRAAADPGPLRLQRHLGGRHPDRGSGGGRDPGAAGRTAGGPRPARADHRGRRPDLGPLLRRERPGDQLHDVLRHPGHHRRRRTALQPAGLLAAGRLLPARQPLQGVRPRARRLLHGPARGSHPRRRHRRRLRLAHGLLPRRRPRPGRGRPRPHPQGPDPRHRRPTRAGPHRRP